MLLHVAKRCVDRANLDVRGFIATATERGCLAPPIKKCCRHFRWRSDGDDLRLVGVEGMALPRLAVMNVLSSEASEGLVPFPVEALLPFP
jgi:hypothetical protein